nr:MAG: hypothetical protein [Bacteriophage sp.]
MGYLMPLARYYSGYDMGTEIKYEEFGTFTEDIINMGLEVWKDLGNGIINLDKAQGLTPSDEALKELINQLRISYQSQELSQKIGESIKRIIKEELEKKNHDLIELAMLLYALLPHISLRMLVIMPRIPWFFKFERQSNPLPFIACTHPQPL